MNRHVDYQDGIGVSLEIKCLTINSQNLTPEEMQSLFEECEMRKGKRNSYEL